MFESCVKYLRAFPILVKFTSQVSTFLLGMLSFVSLLHSAASLENCFRKPVESLVKDIFTGEKGRIFFFYSGREVYFFLINCKVLF